MHAYSDIALLTRFQAYPWSTDAVAVLRVEYGNLRRRRLHDVILIRIDYWWVVQQRCSAHDIAVGDYTEICSRVPPKDQQLFRFRDKIRHTDGGHNFDFFAGLTGERELPRGGDLPPARGIYYLSCPYFPLPGGTHHFVRRCFRANVWVNKVLTSRGVQHRLTIPQQFSAISVQDQRYIALHHPPNSIALGIVVNVVSDWHISVDLLIVVWSCLRWLLGKEVFRRETRAFPLNNAIMGFRMDEESAEGWWVSKTVGRPAVAIICDGDRNNQIIVQVTKSVHIVRSKNLAIWARCNIQGAGGYIGASLAEIQQDKDYGSAEFICSSVRLIRWTIYFDSISWHNLLSQRSELKKKLAFFLELMIINAVEMFAPIN